MYSVTSEGMIGCRVRLHFWRRCALVTTIVGVGGAQILAQCTENQKLTAAVPGGGKGFGSSVSVSGNTAFIGAQFSSAYVYGFNGVDWVEEQKLTSSQTFGQSVSVSGDTAIVGAWKDHCATGDPSCGAAYVFRSNGVSWVEEKKLNASDEAIADQFGWSVSVSGDTVVVGANAGNCAGIAFCGAAYIFRFNGVDWIEEQKLTASDAASLDDFGGSVSLSRDTAIVGAYRDDCVRGHECGSAYVYRFNGVDWVEEQKLTASDANWIDVFGWSVSVSGDTVVVGAPQKDWAGRGESGAAYIFRFNGVDWNEEQKLTASDATADDRFGFSVSVSGDTVVVGARSKGFAVGDSCGSAYVYRFDGNAWVEEQKLTAFDAANGDVFGVSVSASGSTVVVGAAGDDCEAGDYCGAVYVFSCHTVAHLDIKPGSCPNSVNANAKGLVPVALVGSEAFDVNDVDVSSVVLGRSDGLGSEIRPAAMKNGRLRASIEDVATPLDGTGCDCHERGGDAIDDLMLKFSTPEMSRAFELDALPRGERIELVLRGSLLDGTTFNATDCIAIPGTDRDSRKPPSKGK